MLSCSINLNNSYKFFALLANIIVPIAYIVCPSEATTFAFIDTPETEKLLLSPQQEEDPDDEPGKTVPPN